MVSWRKWSGTIVVGKVRANEKKPTKSRRGRGSVFLERENAKKVVPFFPFFFPSFFFFFFFFFFLWRSLVFPFCSHFFNFEYSSVEGGGD